MHRASSRLESLTPFPLKPERLQINDEADNVYHHAPHPPTPNSGLAAGNMKASGALNSLNNLITCGKNLEKPANMHLAWGRERLCEHQQQPSSLST